MRQGKKKEKEGEPQAPRMRELLPGRAQRCFGQKGYSRPLYVQKGEEEKKGVNTCNNPPVPELGG